VAIDPEENAEAQTDDAGRPRRQGFSRRRRRCPLCAGRMKLVDYKDVAFLRRFISDRARAEPRRKVGTCARHQRAVARAIKRARHVALLPYTVDHIRKMGNPFRS